MKWLLKLLATTAIAFGSSQFLAPMACAADNPGVETLAHHLATNAAARASGYSNSYDATGALSNWGYATYSGTNLARLTNAVWSTSFWLHGAQGLSAIAIGFSNGMGGQGLITMVSPRHYLFSAHMHPEGYLAAFLDTNNVIHWRTTLQRMDVTNDIAIGILNADLPPSVKYLPVAPANLPRYLLADDTIQGIGMNQDLRIFSQPMNFGNASYVQWDSRRAIPFGPGTNWNIAIRSGDSSDPEMLLIGNQLVLVSENFALNAGPSYASQIDAINQAMRQLSKRSHLRTDYQLTLFSLKDWPMVRSQ